jgi:putative adhesin
VAKGLDRSPAPAAVPALSALVSACLLCLFLGACVGVGNLTGRARDEWTRSYPLDARGEVQITNTNGRIEIEGVDGAMVDVRAERFARATTDALARDLLPRIDIAEVVTPKLVQIETKRLSGVIIGASVEVQYHVRVPKSALVRIRTTNGVIAVDGLTGRLVANTSNGPISARNLSGGVEARATNGRVEIDVNVVGGDPIDLRTTNGAIQLRLPETAKVNLSAGCVNGEIDTSGLTLELMGEQSRRRVRGRMNGGGTPIELNTVNGKIEVSAR